MCECTYCRTGKCGCAECSPGPGIDYRRSDRLLEEVRREIALERIRIRDQRAPGPERQKVRRWGETGTSPKAVQAARAAENDNQE